MSSFEPDSPAASAFDPSQRRLPWDEHEALVAQATPAMAYRGGDFASWTMQARQRLVDRLGLDPQEENRAFEVAVVWDRPHRLGRIQKLLLRAPGLADMPMYWCLPAETQAPLPVMICLQGHTTGMHCSIGVRFEDESVSEPAGNDRDFALQCLERGVAALCIEQRGFGERRDSVERQCDCQHMAMRALMLGRTLVGERVADVNLACRWLADQPAVDTSRIGIMGNSGGGTTSIYAAALLKAIHLAVPSCSFGRWYDTWFTGSRCVCGYVPGMLHHLDLPDVLALHAPRPVVVVGGEQDYHCPGAPLRQAFDDLRTRYRAAGAADACHLTVGPEGHRFYADLAWPKILDLL
ncbi:alpha/beta hydrolase family protein [Phycisphaerales bacterium AB-hyl4]|uniref:Alpha/beta hydrolase family protein n=1 Tax=Natronomicrosphaera hydrolytica TaxID=3242702 RepID=A0ABV4U8H4_9BACT